jgi:hypothetical protein
MPAVLHIETGGADGTGLTRSAMVALTWPLAPLSWSTPIAGLRYSHER